MIPIFPLPKNFSADAESIKRGHHCKVCRGMTWRTMNENLKLIHPRPALLFATINNPIRRRNVVYLSHLETSKTAVNVRTEVDVNRIVTWL
jgi:hypothetical protein